MIFKIFFTCKSFNSLEFILEWETDEDFLAPRELIFIILFNIFFSVIWHAIFINIRCQWPYFIVVCEKAKQVYKSLAYRKYLFKFLNPYYVRLCREKHGTYKTLESKKKKKRKHFVLLNLCLHSMVGSRCRGEGNTLVSWSHRTDISGLVVSLMETLVLLNGEKREVRRRLGKYG